MIYNLTTPSGIDYWIQKLQFSLYDFMKSTFSFTDSDAGTKYQSYGRCYRNTTKDGVVPQAFVGGIEYNRDLFHDDTSGCVSFFDLGDTVKVDELSMRATVGLTFEINLKTALGLFEERPDEKVRMLIKNHIESDSFGFFITDIFLTEKKVYAEYSGVVANKGKQFSDMQPYHCFKFIMTIQYTKNTPCVVYPFLGDYDPMEGIVVNLPAFRIMGVVGATRNMNALDLPLNDYRVEDLDGNIGSPVATITPNGFLECTAVGECTVWIHISVVGGTVLLPYTLTVTA